MKWVVATMNASAFARTLRSVRTLSRLFVTISTCLLLFLVTTGLMSIAEQKWVSLSSSSMKGAASSLSVSFFMDMLALEMPQLQGKRMPPTFSPKHTVTFLARSMIGIHPADPKSWLVSELPWMRGESSAVLYSGFATSDTDHPADYTPPPDAFRQEESKPDQQAARNPAQQPVQPQGGAAPVNPPAAISYGLPQILIYHSHNRESYLPELKSKKITDPDLAYDQDVNVTLVGKRLKEKIESFGIPTMQSTADYPASVKSFQYAKSYAYSAQTVKEAMAQNSSIGMVLDIHRDSLAREKTTVRIGNQDYAQIYFVVGKKNPQWERNSEFANNIHTRLERRMPGISKGVYGKAGNGNGEYNQSLSPNSMLIEIGGPYNTLEEVYRTTDLLAEIIAELQREAVKAMAPAGTSGTAR